MNDELIEKIVSQNEILIRQNTQIINLLKKLAGESEKTDIGDDELASVSDEIDNEIVFDGNLDVGEVLFVSQTLDIYKLSVKKSEELKFFPPEIEGKIGEITGDSNLEIILDNLTGDGFNCSFNVPLLVALKSLENNIQIDSSICILDDLKYSNIPEILRVSIESGAKKVYLPIKNAIEVYTAPPEIFEYLKVYKTIDDIYESLFKEIS